MLLNVNFIRCLFDTHTHTKARRGDEFELRYDIAWSLFQSMFPLASLFFAADTATVAAVATTTIITTNHRHRTRENRYVRFTRKFYLLTTQNTTALCAQRNNYSIKTTEIPKQYSIKKTKQKKYAHRHAS